MKNVGLFRHGAKLARRSQGSRVEACGVPTIFEFEATNLEVKLHSFGETSPFHDLPDGANVYVEVGVDMDGVRDRQPEVAKAVEAFVRHGRRPKFGPPLADLDAPSGASENTLVEQGAILDWITDVLAGKPVSDFAESFALVRAVQDLRTERDLLWRLDRENLELRKRLTVWCDAIIGKELCTKAARHRLARGDREVWVCAAHRSEALVWQTQSDDAEAVEIRTLPFRQTTGALDEWPGPESRGPGPGPGTLP